jgi:hypothetical protein
VADLSNARNEHGLLPELEQLLHEGPAERRKALYTIEAYLQLVTSLTGVLTRDAAVEEALANMAGAADSASDGTVERAVQAMVPDIDVLLQSVHERIPPRKNWREIADDYWTLCHSCTDMFSHGLSYGWLAARFDCSSLGIPNDFPYHGRIGVGHHAGRAAVADVILLSDGYFLLAKTEEAHARLMDTERSAAELPDSYDLRQWLGTLNSNLCAFARLTVSAFYSFVECFVNSVAEDFLAREPRAAPDKRSVLSGRGSNGRRYSLEHKLEVYPGVIRGDNQRIAVVSNSGRLVEPYPKLRSHLREVRDASAGFAQHKCPIRRPPAEWVVDARRAAVTCVQVAREYWESCFPKRGLPAYLWRFDDAVLKKQAQDRVAAESAEYQWLRCQSRPAV